MISDVQESAQVRIHRYAQTCELIFGQPVGYYRQQLEKQFVAEIDFSRYHLMITGLPRQVYRPFFGTDAFLYSSYFQQIEIEIVRTLEAQGIRCMTTMLLYDHTKRFCMIFNRSPEVSAHNVAKTAAACFDRLYAKIFEMNRTPYCNYTVLSPEIHGYEQLPHAFEELNALSRQQFFGMESEIMTVERLAMLREEVDREQVHEDMAQLRMALRNRDRQSVEKAFNDVMDLQGRARHFTRLENVMHAIRMAADSVLAGSGRERVEEAAFSIEAYPTFAHLRAGLKACLLEIVDTLPDGPTMSAPILEAVRYIRHHYAQDVALEDIARHIGMSPSWLTKHFNQECQCSVPQYLLNVRLEHAKKMLTETSMLVFEVSNAVGFENPRYFVSVFKKATGMTPKAYREYAQQA